MDDSVEKCGVHVTPPSVNSKLFLSTNGLLGIPAEGPPTMAEQRMTYWAAEAEVDEDLEDVDLNLAIGSFGQTDLYQDGASQSQKHTSDDVTKNPRLSSQAPYRRDHYACCATADGATSFCPNPRRRKEGVYGGILREITYQSTTL